MKKVFLVFITLTAFASASMCDLNLNSAIAWDKKASAAIEVGLNSKANIYSKLTVDDGISAMGACENEPAKRAKAKALVLKHKK